MKNSSLMWWRCPSVWAEEHAGESAGDEGSGGEAVGDCCRAGRQGPPRPRWPNSPGDQNERENGQGGGGGRVGGGRGCKNIHVFPFPEGEKFSTQNNRLDPQSEAETCERKIDSNL